MAEKTTNYGLTKPGLGEFYDIGVHNANMDKIDAELKNKIPQVATYYPVNTAMSADDLTVPFALVPVDSNVNAGLFAIVGGTFAWIHTHFYIDTTVTSRRYQIAATYNSVVTKMAYRMYGANGWLPWCEIATADGVAKLDKNGKIPSSMLPDDVGSVKSVNGATGEVVLYGYGTADLEAGVSPLETGMLYFVYK